MLPSLLIWALLIQAYTLCADLSLIYFSRRLHTRLRSSYDSGRRRVFRRSGITVVVLKLILDIPALVLLVVATLSRRAMMEKASATMVDKLSLLPTSFDMTINICFRVSITCIVLLEVRSLSRSIGGKLTANSFHYYGSYSGI